MGPIFFDLCRQAAALNRSFVQDWNRETLIGLPHKLLTINNYVICPSNLQLPVQFVYFTRGFLRKSFYAIKVHKEVAALALY